MAQFYQEYITLKELVHSWKIKCWDFVISFLQVDIPFHRASIYPEFFLSLLLPSLSPFHSFYTLCIRMCAVAILGQSVSRHSLGSIRCVVMNFTPFLRRPVPLLTPHKPINIHHNFSWSGAKMLQRSWARRNQKRESEGESVTHELK